MDGAFDLPFALEGASEESKPPLVLDPSYNRLAEKYDLWNTEGDWSSAIPVRRFEDDRNPRMASGRTERGPKRHCEHTSASRGLRRRDGRRGIMAG